MIAIGVFIVWAAYGIGVQALGLLKGWNLSFRDLWSPTGYYGTQSGQKWPPPLAGNCTIWPDGSTEATLSSDTFPTPATTSTTTSTGAPSEPAGLSNTAAIQKAAANAGWGSGTQWSCLQNVITAESGGNAQALNSGSGAYGIAQALGHGQPGTACPSTGRNEYGAQYGLSTQQAQSANCGNAWYQLVWMMGYIKAQWGTPCAAWANEQSQHWY